MLLKILTGIFIILHGLVHFWYVILAAKLVEYKPEMGWTGNSWLLDAVIPASTIRFIAVFFYSFAALAFIISAVGVLFAKDWLNNGLIIAAVISTFTILLFFDGSGNMLVQKGLIGLIINLAIILFCYFN